ncbi:NUDIX hydrolase [Parvibaculum sp.]|uniref:NUDIX hydrolase n=1 Tax=Parvibaculum sp. TaxID=2024848 RepID=UPI002CE7FF5D|nr:NUDIX domain-containing protein [Parvibaculum sp.]HUD49937.1 NUDIX domain-containing protein [Parvibaculum sp.]
MQIRPTVRVLFFDPQGRLLLMCSQDPDVADQDGRVPDRHYWFAIGGGIEPGETPTDAALREIAEETGHTRFRLGPPVWYRESVLTVKGEKWLFAETFFVAWTEESDLSRENWTELERAVVKDLKWWEVDELMASDEIIFPLCIREHLPPILEGEYPAALLTIGL